MNTYRMYIKDTKKYVYSMLMIEANSFRDALSIIEPDIDSHQEIISVMRYAEEDLPIDDPFIAGVLLDEMTNALEHLVKTGYDTSHITAVLAGYNNQTVEAH